MEGAGGEVGGYSAGGDGEFLSWREGHGARILNVGICRTCGLEDN